MSREAQSDTKPTTRIGFGVYFLAGPVVVAIVGIGGKIGERLG
ncbi:MAG: hypothetical protein ACHRXM_21505 [Isosphaerales bacterium]